MLLLLETIPITWTLVMTCGPFNLSHATDANLVFNCKPHIENNHDILEYSVSLDGSLTLSGR